MKAKVLHCPCGHPTCQNWLVSPVADLQGVSFTKEQAEAVAELLNSREWPPKPEYKAPRKGLYHP